MVNKMESALKLNLGSGQNLRPGYLNVDKFGHPDMLCDLELFPWPWEESTVDEIVLNHVLEHLGETKEVYLGIIKELYRVCKPGALIKITVPHPRHDDFLNDPTHVRIVTPESLKLFSKKFNAEWARIGAANSPLGFYLNVDFDLARTNFMVDEPWFSRLKSGEIKESELWEISRQYNNVIKQMSMELKVIK